jgi:hypothetical protein
VISRILLSSIIRTGILTSVILSAGCGGGRSVPASATNPSPSLSPAPQAADRIEAAASPGGGTPAVGSPSPTPNPAIKQAGSQPGVPVAVPESMKRAMTPEEMQKAMQALPPEVRQRIMGLQKMPRPSPAPTR